MSQLIIFFIWGILQIEGQTQNGNVAWISPTECALKNQIFNPILLNCVTCPNGMIAASNSEISFKNDLSSCICSAQKENTTTTIKSNEKMQCPNCLKDEVLSYNKLFCTKCLGIVNGECPRCKENEIITYTNINYTFSQTCVECPNNTIPDKNKLECVECDKSSCFCKLHPQDCSRSANDDSNVNSVRLEEDQGRYFQLTYANEYLSIAEVQCRSGNSPQQCQHLANLCVLTDFNQFPQSPCFLLENIRRNTFNRQIMLPNLFYYNTEAGIELFRETAIDGIFNVAPEYENNYLDIIAMTYSQNGKFIGTYQVEDGFLQLCPQMLEIIRKAFKFGRLYRQNCQLEISEVIRWWKFSNLKEDNFLVPNGTLFYEFYLRYVQSDGSKIYPIAILNENYYDTSTGYVNRFESDSRWMLSRRLFLVDRQEEYGMDGAKILFRVPKQISFNINLQPSRQGRIFPPYLRIRYIQYIYNKVNTNERVNKNQTEIVDEKKQIFQCSFSIEYFVNSFSYDKTIEILMATFCSISVLLAALKAYSWGRRAGKVIVDFSTIIKFLLYTCENISNVFLMVFGLLGVWIIYAYKLQKYLVYLPPTYEQEWSFVAYMIAATVLKAVVFLHTYISLALVETFFIDWERPRLASIISATNDSTPGGLIENRSREPTMFELSSPIGSIQASGTESNITRNKNLSKKSQLNPIVIWRTYLIANEWNELQNYRKTSLAIQLLGLLFCLEYLNFNAYAIIQPGFERGNTPKEFLETRMSRFVVNLSFYLVIAMTQWLFQVLIVEKLADPFHNFMDLCSVANISVLAMTHPLRGYYIHGRSVHGLADTDMYEINMFLQREKENLCGLRGLENASEIQTFVVNMPRVFRERLDQMTTTLRAALREVNLRQSGVDPITTKIDNTAKIYSEINQYLKDVVDHVDPTCDYIINDGKLIEEIVGLELSDTSKIGSFIRDSSEISYTMAFIYGNEWTFMSFEMLFFCIIDLFTHSRILAAILTYFLSQISRKTAKIFFTNNLVKSSLIDHRFLS